MPAPIVASILKGVGKQALGNAAGKRGGGNPIVMLLAMGMVGCLIMTGVLFGAAMSVFGGGGAADMFGQSSACQIDDSAAGAPQSKDIENISQVALNAYYKASQATGVKWELIAGIATVETGNGTYGGSKLDVNGNATPPIQGHVLDGSGVGGNTTPMYYHGPHHDPSGYDRAVGVTQFLLSTWYGGAGKDGNGDGQEDPQNVYDAALATGTKLRADGALTDEYKAIYAYNHLDSYVQLVQKYEHQYEADASKAASSGGGGSAAPSGSPQPTDSGSGGGQGGGQGGGSSDSADPTDSANPSASSTDGPEAGAGPGAISKVFQLGDSLTVGMRDTGKIVAKWKQRGASADIDAISGLTLQQAVARVNADKARIADADTVIVELGTNNYTGTAAADNAAVSKLIKALAVANPNAVVYWVNTYSTVKDMTAINTAITNASTKNNFTVIDWNSEATTNASKYTFDKKLGVHLTGNGYATMAQFVVDKAESGGGSDGAAGGCDGSLSTNGNPAGAVGKVVAYARAQLGKPYVFGAAGPDSFDCSGLTMMAYRQVNVNLPHLASDQWKLQPHVPKGQEQPGDLVFFPGDDGTAANPGHVGMVLDPAKHQMIDAPQTGTPVEVDDYSHWPGGVVGFARPKIPGATGGTGGGTSDGTPSQNAALGHQMLIQAGFGEDQWAPLNNLWTKESGWRINAANSSGAFGIPQALPGSKMSTVGSDWQTNPATQITWGLQYIKGRYGTPAAAWRHSQQYNWY